jgi:hypothetical protein
VPRFLGVAGLVAVWPCHVHVAAVYNVSYLSIAGNSLSGTLSPGLSALTRLRYTESPALTVVVGLAPTARCLSWCAEPWAPRRVTLEHCLVHVWYTGLCWDSYLALGSNLLTGPIPESITTLSQLT